LLSSSAEGARQDKSDFIALKETAYMDTDKIGNARFIGQLRDPDMVVKILDAQFKLMADIIGEQNAKAIGLDQLKAQVVAANIHMAEQQYLATVRLNALLLMERHRTLTAAEAVAEVENVILTALLGA
jgi:hypothetical protein